MYINRTAEQNLTKALNTGKVVILLGARQVGKTTLLQHILSSQSTLFLNLDIRVDQEKLLSAGSISPQEAIKNLGSPQILVIDEAQRLPESSRIVKGWFDSGVKTKIILSGSSSLDLLDQSAESLTGRNIKIYLPPLTFTEIIRTQDWYPIFVKSRPSDPHAFSDQLESYLLSAMIFGGYPDVYVHSNKPQLLTNLITDYLLKDVFQIGLVKNPDLIQKLLTLLAYQTGSVVSVSELANNLNLSRVTVDRYLDLLERTFIIFRLPAFSTNPRKEIAKSHKIYFWDTGVRNALIGELSLNKFRGDIGQIWENWVVAEFAKKNFLEDGLNKLHFWRSQTGSEVDLVVKNITGELSAYEIKWSPGKTTRAFASRYKIPVNLIHRGNFVNYLYSTP